MEDVKDKINIAINARYGLIWSQQRVITFIGNVDSVMNEIESIKEEQAEKQRNNVKKQNVASIIFEVKIVAVSFGIRDVLILFFRIGF